MNVEGIRGTIRDRIYKNGLDHGYKAVTLQGGELRELVDLRTAFTSGGTAYACIWVHGNNFWNSGSGSAGGYGYDKPSAAAEAAIRAAGVHLDHNISGMGNGAIMEAVKAIGEALADSPVFVVEMYA